LDAIQHAAGLHIPGNPILDSSEPSGGGIHNIMFSGDISEYWCIGYES
jgi:hypothetical protein